MSFICPKGFAPVKFLLFIVVIKPYKLTAPVENYGDRVNKRQEHMSFIKGNIVSKINVLYYVTL